MSTLSPSLYLVSFVKAPRGAFMLRHSAKRSPIAKPNECICVCVCVCNSYETLQIFSQCRSPILMPAESRRAQAGKLANPLGAGAGAEAHASVQLVRATKRSTYVQCHSSFTGILAFHACTYHMHLCIFVCKVIPGNAATCRFVIRPALCSPSK